MKKSAFVFNLVTSLLSLAPFATQAAGNQPPLSPKYFAALNSTNATKTSSVPPTRLAKGKAVITKTKYLKKGNEYERQVELVCSKTADVPVFEVKDPNDHRTPDPAMIQCESTVGTEPVKLFLSTAVVVAIAEPGKNDPDAAELPEIFGKPMKAAFGSFAVGANPNRVATQDLASNFFWTLDLNLQTMIFQLSPNPSSNWDCSDLAHGCKPKMMEYFSATLFIQD